MFPINDTHSNVIGFTSRILQDKEGLPAQAGVAKYVNTPETAVYSKSRALYGIDKAKQEIRKNNLAIIVEGQMDVIASHQAGVKNVVASSGTALTLEQIKLLKRYTANLILGFDVDMAGQEATKRGIDIALQQEMNVKIITLLKGKDPDECIQESLALWEKAIREAKPIMEYYFETVLSPLDVSKLENKKKAAKILLPIISKFGNRIEQDYWLKELSQKLEINEGAVREALKKIQKIRKFPKLVILEKRKKDKTLILGERFLALILKFSNIRPSLFINYLIPFKIKILSDENLQNIARQLVIYYNNYYDKYGEKSFILDLDSFIKLLKEDRLRDYVNFLILLAEKEFSDKEPGEIEEEIERTVKQLKKEDFSAQLKKIQQDLQKAEREGKREEVEKISQELNQLTKELAKLI